MTGPLPWRGFDSKNVRRGRMLKRTIIAELIRCLREFPDYPGIRSKKGWRRVRRRDLNEEWEKKKRRKRDNDVLVVVKKAFGSFGVVEKSNQGLYCSTVAQAWRSARSSRLKKLKKRQFKQKYSNAKVDDKIYQKYKHKIDTRLFKGCAWSINQWSRWSQTFWIKYRRWVPRNNKKMRKLIDERRAVVDAKRHDDDERRTIQDSRVPLLRIGSCNITSAQRLPDLIEKYHSRADVFLVQETNSINNTWPGVAGWKLINFPRKFIRGGGTGVVYREAIGRVSASPGLRYRDGEDGVEWLWARVPCVDGAVYVCSVYSPPRLRLSADVKAIFREHLEYLRARPDCVGLYVAGDLNCSLFDKQKLSEKNVGGRHADSCARGRIWRTFLEQEQHGLLLNVSDMSPTFTNGRTNTIVDYAFWFGGLDAIMKFAVVDGILDHEALMSVMLIPTSRVTKRRRVNFPRLEKERYRDLFQKKLNDYNIDADCEIHDWYSAILSIGGETLKYSRVGIRKPGRPWWNDELKSLSSRLRALRRRRKKLMRRGQSHLHIRQEMLAKRKELTVKLREAKREYWRSLRRSWDTSQMKMREAYGFVKYMMKRSSRPQVAHSRQVMEDAWRPVIGSYPPESCNDAAARASLSNYDWKEVDTSDMQVSLDELKQIIRILPVRKAPGVDEVSNLVLKSLTDDFLMPLVNLFNRILEDPSKIPSQWFYSNVFLIPKTDDPGPLEYRPITLLSCVAKLLEKILWERVKSWDVPLKFNQGGFVSERGCVEQLWRLVTVDQSLRAQKWRGMALLLDLKKAYDRVPFSILILKLLNRTEIPSYFTRFVKFWLEGHERFLLVDESKATALHVNRGVPQGSVLSPFLFNIFIDDLIGSLENLPSKIKISPAGSSRPFEFSTLGYADDIAQTAMVPVNDQGNVFRASVEVATDWEIENGMEFAPSKSFLFPLGRIQRQNADLAMSFHGEVMRESKMVEYLGVKLAAGKSSILKNDKAIASVKKFAKSRYTMLESTEGCSLIVGTVIADSIHCPKLLYGCEVYKPNLKTCQRVLNAVYRKLLQCFDSDKACVYRKFLGCRDFDDLVMARVVRFVLKLATCRFQQLQRWLLAVIDTDLPWCKYVKTQFVRAGKLGLLDDGCPKYWTSQLKTYLTGHEVCSDRLDNFNYKWKVVRPKAHPSVYHTPHSAHFVYIFVRGHLNPQNAKDEHRDGALRCFLCNKTKSDKISHYVCWCQKTQPRLQQIAESHGLSLDQLKYLITHLADDASAEWKDSCLLAVAEACKWIWKTRVPYWRAWKQKGCPLPIVDEDEDSWESDSDSSVGDMADFRF